MRNLGLLAQQNIKKGNRLVKFCFVSQNTEFKSIRLFAGNVCLQFDGLGEAGLLGEFVDSPSVDGKRELYEIS